MWQLRDSITKQVRRSFSLEILRGHYCLCSGGGVLNRRHIRRQRVAQYADYSLHELIDMTLLYGEAATRLYAERYQQRRHTNCRKCIFLQETDSGPI